MIGFVDHAHSSTVDIAATFQNKVPREGRDEAWHERRQGSNLFRLSPPDIESIPGTTIEEMEVGGAERNWYVISSAEPDLIV